MFMAELFSQLKHGGNSCPPTNEWTNKMWYVYIQWNIIQPSKRNPVIRDNMNASGGCYAKRNMPDTEAKMLHRRRRSRLKCLSMAHRFLLSHTAIISLYSKLKHMLVGLWCPMSIFLFLASVLECPLAHCLASPSRSAHICSNTQMLGFCLI